MNGEGGVPRPGGSWAPSNSWDPTAAKGLEVPCCRLGKSPSSSDERLGPRLEREDGAVGADADEPVEWATARASVSSSLQMWAARSGARVVKVSAERRVRAPSPPPSLRPRMPLPPPARRRPQWSRRRATGSR